MIKAIKSLHDAFHDSNITYCHWKSTPRMNEVIRGDTDLDVLVDRKEVSKVWALLSELGWYLMNLPNFRQYPEVMDFLGFDAETGKIIHLHLHLNIVGGERFLKSYHFPYAEAILKSRVWCSEKELYTVSKGWEIILLLVRAAAKNDFANKLLSLVSKNHIDAVEKEFALLYPQGKEEARQILSTRSDGLSQVLETIIGAKQPWSSFKTHCREIRKHIKKYRRYSHPTCIWKQWTRIGKRIITDAKRKILNNKTTGRRRFLGGGRLYAFVGVDGAGKSTQVKNLSKWLEKEVDCETIYLGTGDGRAAWYRWPFLKGLRLAESLGLRSRGKNRRIRLEKEKTDRRPSLAKAIWVLLISMERLKKVKQAARLRRQGVIVLADRWPQDQIQDTLDGPRLKAWRSEKSFIGAIARLEYRSFKYAQTLQADVLFKLVADSSVVAERKPNDFDQKRTTRSIELLNLINYKNAKETASIDGNNSVNIVSKKIKKKIWNGVL